MTTITIKHKRSGKIADITPEKWANLVGRNRNWEKIGEKEIALAPKKPRHLYGKGPIELTEVVDQDGGLPTAE